MKKPFSLMLILVLLAGVFCCGVTPVSAASEAAPSVDFDEDHVVLSFGAISDLHVLSDVNNAATQKYATAIRLLKQYAGGHLDAITVAGDISNSYYTDGIGEAFRTVTDEGMGEDANVFFVTGNHDAESEQWDTLRQFYSDQSKYLTKDLPSSQHDRGNRHMVIGGYHYISVNMMAYWGSGSRFDPQDLEWLDRELAAARADAPGKPIFVYTHAPIRGAGYGGYPQVDEAEMYTHLKDYPEVIAFSGHVHSPIHEETAIYQRDFTALDCGAVQYMSIGGGYLQSLGNGNVNESGLVSNGLLVQVDKHNNVKVTRLDFTNGAPIKQPFYIPAPDLVNKTHLTRYNNDYFHKGNTAPVFGAHAGVSGVPMGDAMAVTFDAATDNDMVHHYMIEIQSQPSGAIKMVKAFSEFYLYPTVDKYPMAYTMQVPFTLPEGDTSYQITLCAVDSMGKRSEPLTYTSTPNDTPPVLGGVADGETYYTTQRVTVTDDNLAAVYVNGQPVEGEVVLEGNKDITYSVMAVDQGGNRFAMVIVMKPVTEMASVLGGATEQTVTFLDILTIKHLIKDVEDLLADANASAADRAELTALKARLEGYLVRIDTATEALNTPAIDAVRDITAEDATAEDAEGLLAALADYRKALATYGGNYNRDGKTVIAEEMTRIEEALTAIGVEIPPAEETPDAESEDTDPADTPAFPWLWVGVGGAVLVGALLFLFLRKKK